MKLLVTGGTGYVGKYIVEGLKKNHELFLISREKHSSDDMHYIQADITNQQQLLKKLKGKTFDAIVHVGGLHPRNPFATPEVSLMANVIGTHNITVVAKACKAKKIIYTSSLSIYGKNCPSLLTEEGPAKPQNPYALSKFTGEELLRLFYQETGIDVVILRLCGVFGGDRNHGAVYNFITNAKANKAISVANPLSSTDMIYVDDVVRAVKHALKVKGFEIFNISSGEHLTVLELAQKIVSLLHSQSHIDVAAEDPHDIFKLHLDNTRMIERLHVHPHSIEQYVKTLVK